MKQEISIIAAMDENRGIGKDGKLLWHIPEDLKRFKVLTTGHPIIMGRKTFESIGRPLPNRTNIIITRDSQFTAADCIVTHSLNEALNRGEGKPGDGEVFVIGGGEIYRQALPLTTKLYLTLVEGKFEADTFFPDYSEFNKVLFEESGALGDLKYKFLELKKKFSVAVRGK